MLDYSKYGFNKHSENNGHIKYVAEIEGEVIQLSVLGGTHTLKIVGKRDIMVANRYEVTSQKELDFLILCGRTSALFTSFDSVNLV